MRAIRGILSTETMAVRTIEVRERVLARNDEIAARVRERLRSAGVPTFNLVSSPGSGKTLLLERTLADLGRELRIAIVTGDVQTQNDADRLARHTDNLVQAIVTNGACHLDARQVETALEAIDLDTTDLLFIENVGNLVCPAAWDLGESAKIALFSVTEGEDKPSKYPGMFRAARWVVFTKMDLLPHVPFNIARAEELARAVNPDLRFLKTSALEPNGLREWYDFLRQL
jgi:hydrogenase nickel incorporation protein HypB